MQKSILGPWANIEERLIQTPEVLARKLAAFRELKMKVGLTSGAFDMKHVGHERYLALAKQTCDVLVVGVDTDEKVRRRKGPHRPVVPEMERFEQVCHTRYADIVVPKGPDEPRWNLIKLVSPDVLIVSEREYADGDASGELQELVSSWGGKVELLPSQAETSTTARLRMLMVENLAQAETKMVELFQQLRGAIGVSR
ncbi:MAG: hypothetical protein A3C11_01010 [Candidatus Sungbacteria bacterium RIFCSPHIGHO2_02_FULL_49_12]|uniref:Cytidyltransferase-like domain-containing protein n=1 Tax=Candidatus Sungbacteria bacterium RIFCSPHIGHO2_02_FULL_49_12 TaxID=1802271 RepID=A0A1G2KNG1_9BACT|nr:MAG: hypothetical protein A3C11_01010 [Candidatus Sungbacteria bacterium RIFCSPHIGHO2_02_FULL_49_12]